MIENFIAIYVLFDDTMLEIGHKEPVNRNSSYSELIEVALMAAKLPKRIHAVTVDGLMKVIFFIFVFTLNEIT